MQILEYIKQAISNGQVAEYNEVSAKLAELKSLYGTEVPDASSKEGYNRAKEITNICTSIRTATESTRKEWKAPVLDFGRLIDSEAKRIVAEVLAVETPYRDAYQAVDQIKKQRKLDIENRFIEIRDVVKIAFECNSQAIETMINDLAEYDVSVENFGRRVDEASVLVAQTLEKLTDLHVKAIEREAEELRIEAERAELEKLRIEAEERRRKDEEDRIRLEREAEIKAAAECARIEAEEKAKHAAELAEKERIEAIHRAEQAEIARIESERLAEQQRIEAEEKSRLEAIAYAERAIADERKRRELEDQAKAEEQKRLEENKKHAGKVHKAIADAISLECGIDLEIAKDAVRAIVGKKIPHITINY